MMEAHGLWVLLMLAVAAQCIHCSSLRATPDAIKAHRAVASARRQAHTQASYEELPATVQVAALQQAQPDQQLRSWAGVALSQPQVKPEQREQKREPAPRKHKKAHKHNHHHDKGRGGDGDDEGEGPEFDLGKEMFGRRAADSMAEMHGDPGRPDWLPPEQTPDRVSADVDGPGSDGIGSIGSITQFSRVLKINYEGEAGQTGVAPDASVAAAALEWSLTASSPHFDNAPKAKPDGAFGHWELTIDQEVPFIPAGRQPFIQFEGNASYPRRIIMTGRLSSVMESLPVSDASSAAPSTRTSSQGEVPDVFLTNMRRQLSVTACEYSGPCNWLLQPNFGPLLGKLTLSPPITGSHSIQELTDKRWLPGGVVEVVCTLDRGQEELVDCPTGPEKVVMGV